MMSIETWLAFVFASTMVVVIPGPNIVLTVNYALLNGRRSGLATVPGVALGALVGMCVSLAGAGAILTASATMFIVLKVAGALYLMWMAYQLWTAPVQPLTLEGERADAPLGRLFLRSFLISVLNPKGPVFYIAFVPQFIDPTAPAFGQFGVLIVTWIGVAMLNSVVWLYGASSLRSVFNSGMRMRLVNRLGASCLFVAGMATLRVSR